MQEYSSVMSQTAEAKRIYKVFLLLRIKKAKLSKRFSSNLTHCEAINKRSFTLLADLKSRKEKTTSEANKMKHCGSALLSYSLEE